MTNNEYNYRGCFEWYKDENADIYIKRMIKFKNLKNYERAIIQEVELKQRKKLKKNVVELITQEYCTIQSIEIMCSIAIQLFNKDTTLIERNL